MGKIEPENLQAARDMTGDVSRETPDPIDGAIAATEPTPGPDSMVGDFRFTDGKALRLVVPIDFTVDQFETAVGILMQMRVAADQRKEAATPKLAVPDRSIVSLDGRRLT